MSANNNGQHDDLGDLADIIADVRADLPSEAEWQRACHNLTARLESHRPVMVSDATTDDHLDTESRLGGPSLRRKLVAGGIAACAVAAGIVMAVVYFHRPEEAVVTPEPSGEVESAVGPCLRVAEGQPPSALAAGDTLRPKDRVAVGPSGALELRLADGSRLWLRSSTDVEYVGPRSKTSAVVRLHRGEIRADVARDPNAPFRIWTPAGSLKVLGTEFDVRVLPDITQEEREEDETMRRLRSTLRRAILVVSVLSGSVAVEANGDQQIVAEGQRTLVAAHAAPAASDELQDVDYLRNWLQRPTGNAKAESLAFVAVRDNLLYSLVATDTESGKSRRIADFVGCLPQVVQQFGPDLAIVKTNSVIFAFWGNQPIGGAGRPLVNDQVSLVNLTTGERLPMVPLKDCDPLYMQLSPDRRQLAFVGKRDVGGSDTPEFGLFVFDLETFKLRRLLSGALKTVPHWSPDSRWLAVSKSPGYQDNHEIVLVDALTGEVTDMGLKGAGVHFSPDGKRLVYSSGIKKSGSWTGGVPTWGNLFVAAVQERKPKQLTHLPEGGALLPSFSPDGSRLVYWQASKEKSGPVRLHEIDTNSGKDRVITEGHILGKLRWLTANSRVLLSFTEFPTGEQSEDTGPIAKVKLVDLAAATPTVREFTPKVDLASSNETDPALSDRLYEVFVAYRDAVKAQDLHRLDEAQAKYAEARDRVKAIVNELEASAVEGSPSRALQQADLAPYLDLLQEEADLSQIERVTRMVKQNLVNVGSLLRTYHRRMGQLPLKSGEQLTPLNVDRSKGPNRQMTFEEVCRFAIGAPWQVNHISGTDTERARHAFLIPGDDPDKITTSFEVVRSDNEKGVFVLRTPELPNGRRLEATYRVIKRGKGAAGIKAEIAEVN